MLLIYVHLVKMNKGGLERNATASKALNFEYSQTGFVPAMNGGGREKRG